MNLRSVIKSIRAWTWKTQPGQVTERDGLTWLNYGPAERTWCLVHREKGCLGMPPEPGCQPCFACVIRELRIEQKEWPRKLLEERQCALLEAAKIMCGHCSQGQFPLIYKDTRQIGGQLMVVGTKWLHDDGSECRASRIHDAIVGEKRY